MNESFYEKFGDLIWRALHTAWQTFLASWPVGALFTDLGAWKIAGLAALNAAVGALFSGIKTYLAGRRVNAF